MPVAHRFARRVPPFVEEASDEHRKLCPELCYFLDWKLITERMERRPQCNVRAVPILRRKLFHHVIEPAVDFLYGGIEHV